MERISGLIRLQPKAQQLLRWLTVWPQYTWAEKWWADVPLSVEEFGPTSDTTWAEDYLRIKWHLDPSNRWVTIHQHYRQTDRTTVPYKWHRANCYL